MALVSDPPHKYAHLPCYCYIVQQTLNYKLTASSGCITFTSKLITIPSAFSNWNVSMDRHTWPHWNVLLRTSGHIFFYCLSNYQLLTVATAAERCKLCFLQLSPMLSTLLSTFAKRTPMISSPLCFISCSWLIGLAAITFFNKLKNPDTGFCSSFQSGGRKKNYYSEILCSHSSVAEDASIVGCGTVSLG